MAEVAAIVGVVDQGLGAAQKSLELWNKIQDQLIPWKTFEDASKTLKQYEKDYSTDAGKIVGEITTLLLNCQDQYDSAVRDVYEWCCRVSSLLKLYLELFDKYDKENAEDQKKIIIKVLQNGVDKMNSAQEELGKSSMSFNDAAGKLSELNTILERDSDAESAYFSGQVAKMRTEAYLGALSGVVFGPLGLAVAYSISAGVVEGNFIPALKAQLDEVKNSYEKLQKVIEKARSDITDVKHKLSNEINVIGEMKMQTEDTKDFFELSARHVDTLKKSANELIALAAAYQERHKPAMW